MTSEMVQPPQATSQTDPLAKLRRRIEQARQPDIDRRAVPAEAEDGDPLERLRRRIDEASEPALDGPMAELYETIRHARELLDASLGYATDVEADDPIDRLERQMERESEAIGRRPVVEFRRASAPSETAGTAGGSEPTTSAAPTSETDSTAALGHEVERLLERRDLPGPTRAEAARRLANQIEHPDPDALRDILELLIAGE